MLPGNPPPAGSVFVGPHITTSTAMFQLLVVCMGNICRSPMASAVLQTVASRRGLLDHLRIDSAGTHGSHQGEPADRRARLLALQRGHAAIAHERARRVRDDDFERFDLILAMDSHNLAHLRQRCPPAQAHKLQLFLDYAGLGAQDVPDPYYGPAEGFEVVLDLCERGAEGVLQRLGPQLGRFDQAP